MGQSDKKYFYQVLNVKKNIRESSPSSAEHLSAKKCLLCYKCIDVANEFTRIWVHIWWGVTDLNIADDNAAPPTSILSESSSCLAC